jgi:glycosyltransferase involved in cell wall biosynthesis
VAPPLVSIIIPCFNSAKWLEEAVKSALAQTHGNVEVVVVDDGSTDASVSIARRFEGPRLKVILSPHRGASAARNAGLVAAKGDFIQFLDADDLLSPDKVAEQVELLAGNPPGKLATSGLVFFNDGGSPQGGLDTDGLPYAGDCDSPLAFLLRLYGLDGPAGMVQTSQWLVPRSVTLSAGPWDETLSVDDDGEYFARVVERSSGIKHTMRGRVFYRKHPGNGSLSGTWRRSEARLTSAIQALHGKRKVLIRLGVDSRGLRTLAPFYCEWALAAYPHFPALSREALEGARQCGDPSPVPHLATPKGQFLQAVLGWRMARRVQAWLQ